MGLVFRLLVGAEQTVIGTVDSWSSKWTMYDFFISTQLFSANIAVTIIKYRYVGRVYQPASTLRGVVVITSTSSVKMHWYTPASDKLK